MKFLNQFVVVMSVYVAVTYAFNCDRDSWYRIGNGRKCVHVVEGRVGPLSVGDEECGRLFGSRVLTIKSKEEQDFVHDLVYNKLRMEEDIWLGGQRQDGLKFIWRNDGELINKNEYSNWAPNRPTLNFPKACVVMQSNNSAAPSKWVDQYCFSAAAVVCENFHRDVLPDRPNNNSTNDNCYDCVNDERLNRRLNEMRREFEERMSEMSRRMNKQSEAIEQLLNAVENRYENYDRKIESNRLNIVRLADRIDNVGGLDFELDFEQIRRNFTGIANVLSHYSSQIRDLLERIDELDSRPSDGDSENNNNGDLNNLRYELRNYVEQLVKSVDVGVEDARLSYVSYRRALQVRKRGQWSSVGFV